MFLTVSKATTSSAAMAWFDLPAASIRSTSSSRLVSCSTRPGTAAAGAPGRERGPACGPSNACSSRARQPSGTPAAAWPAACALTTRMMTNPTSTTLACLRRHGARAFPHGEFLCDGIPTQLLQEVLANPAEFPLGWVLGAEQAISASVKEPPLADIADQQGWFT